MTEEIFSLVVLFTKFSLKQNSQKDVSLNTDRMESLGLDPEPKTYPSLNTPSIQVI